MTHMVFVIENDTCGTQKMDDTEIYLTCGNLTKTRELIKSLRDEHSRRERVVAQYVTDVTFLRTFFQMAVSVVMCLSGPFVVPIDELKMKPRLMMAALITGT